MKNHYSILIRTCWIVLVCCFLAKLFGGNYFEIAVQNEKFIAACNFVDSNLLVKMTLACAMYVFSTYLYLCIVLKEKTLTREHAALFLPLMMGKSILGWYLPIAAFVLDFIIVIVVPMIMTRKVYKCLLCGATVMIFQIISLVIRDIGISNFNNNLFLIQAVMQIDYYIMIILYYLYTFKNGEI